MTGQKLIIVDSCADCTYGSYQLHEKEYVPFCWNLGKILQTQDNKLPTKDTHPDCKLESVKGFL
jgi:hypothetical protein